MKLLLPFLMVLLFGCATVPKKSERNPVATFPLRDVEFVQSARWSTAESSLFPIPLATYTHGAVTDEPAVMKRIYDICRTLAPERGFLPMCGFDAQLAFVGEKGKWLATVELSCDGATIVIGGNVFTEQSWTVKTVDRNAHQQLMLIAQQMAEPTVEDATNNAAGASGQNAEPAAADADSPARPDRSRGEDGK